jgi:predicted nucleic acid-binding protein
MALILDTSVVFAALDRDDAFHEPARGLIESSVEMLVVPSPAVPEIDYLLNQRIGPGAAIAFVDDIIAGAFVVEELGFEDYPRVREVMDRYDDVGFVDAAILTLAERMDEPKVATLDHRHFAMMRPRHVDALELLPAT